MSQVTCVFMWIYIAKKILQDMCLKADIYIDQTMSYSDVTTLSNNANSCFQNHVKLHYAKGI